MKKLIIPVFALALAAGAPSIVWAQNDNHDKDHPHAAAGQGDAAKPVKTAPDHGAPNGGQNGSHNGGQNGNGNQNGGHTGGTHHHNSTGGSNAMSGGGKNTHADEQERTRQLNRGGTTTSTDTQTKNDNLSGGNRDNNRDRDNDHNANGNNNNNNGNHHNADLSRFHHAVQATHHFRIGAYHAPQNYRYQRWGIGERMPNYYFTRDYWLTDFAIYDLETPPDGYVWVRFGPDALLIDEDTGEVVEVEYGIFL